MVSVSFTNTLASDTTYRYRWFLIIDTSIGIADAQAPILVSVSLKTYGIAHLCCGNDCSEFTYPKVTVEKSQDLQRIYTPGSRPFQLWQDNFCNARTISAMPGPFQQCPNHFSNARNISAYFSLVSAISARPLGRDNFCYTKTISSMPRPFLLRQDHFCYADKISATPKPFLLRRDHFCYDKTIPEMVLSWLFLLGQHHFFCANTFYATLRQFMPFWERNSQIEIV